MDKPDNNLKMELMVLNKVDNNLVDNNLVDNNKVDHHNNKYNKPNSK